MREFFNIQKMHVNIKKSEKLLQTITKLADQLKLQEF